MSITLPWRIPAFGPQIETSLTTVEATELTHLAHRRNVLEIGAAYGYSTVLMARAAAHVLSIDPHIVHGSLDIHSGNMETYRVEDRVGRLVGPSRAMLPPLSSRQFHFIFVDGDHTAEGVEFDLAQSLRLVKTGGHIAFHDWDETTCPDVKRVLEAWRRPDYIVDTLAVYHV